MRTCGSSCPFPQAPAGTVPPHARATGFGDDRGHFTSTTPPSEHIKCLPLINVRIFLHLFCTMNQHLPRALINANSLKNWGRIHALSGLPCGSAVKDLSAVQELLKTLVRSPGWEDPMEEGMATHSSILAWRIPWTEEPGGLWFIGSQTRT